MQTSLHQYRIRGVCTSGDLGHRWEPSPSENKYWLHSAFGAAGGGKSQPRKVVVLPKVLHGAIVPIQMIQRAAGAEQFEELKLMVILRINGIDAALKAQVPLVNPFPVHKGKLNSTLARQSGSAQTLWHVSWVHMGPQAARRARWQDGMGMRASTRYTQSS